MARDPYYRKENLLRKIDDLSKRLGVVFKLDSYAGGHRLTTDRGDLVSDRVKGLKAMRDWIDAFERGIEWSGMGPMRQALKDAPIFAATDLDGNSVIQQDVAETWINNYNKWYNKDRERALNAETIHERSRYTEQAS